MSQPTWEETSKHIRRITESPLRFVRVIWTDLSSAIRFKSVHVCSIDTVAADGIACAAAAAALPIYGDHVIPETGCTAVGEIRLVPDWNRAFELPYSPGNIMTFGDFFNNRAPHTICARGFLKKMIREAALVGLEVKAAFEEEFVMLQPNLAPLEDSCYCEMKAGNLAQNFIHEMVDSIILQGLVPELYHPESAPGQHEITWKYTDVLNAADNHIIFRQTAHATALRHNVVVTFLPKLTTSAAGNGLHAHMSIWREGVNVFPTEEGDHFMAGVLHHLPSLLAISAASPNSYERLKPHSWAGCYACWGYDNREAALRVPTTADGGKTNFEFKTCDATSNPYLVLGSMIAAGLWGIKNKAVLPPNVQIDPEELKDKPPLLPTTFTESLDQLEKNEVLKEAMGPELHNAYLAVKRDEVRELSGKSNNDLITMFLTKF